MRGWIVVLVVVAACHRDPAPVPAPPPLRAAPPPPVPSCPREGEGITVVDDQLVVPSISFDLYTGTVAAGSLPNVDAVARRLQACAQLTLEIEVHTDTFRMSEFNLRQSQKVADAIRDRLVAEGVPASRLAACGYGESRPITAALTFPERNANARVEWHRVAMPFACPTIAP